ncbi:MAG TPA: hypothetical protein VHC43_02445 [Mycobacteriales bacterium]|nr:hypothetical protein [Mycobacteriales bacterium]
MKRLPLAAALCATMLTGCGSTVQLSARPVSAGSSGGDLSIVTAPPAPDPGSGHGAAAAPPATQPLGQPQSSHPSHRSSQPISSPTISRTAASTAATANSSGSGPVRVGLLYVSGATALAQSLGISGLSTGDPVAQAKAITAYINGHGGLAGRRIQLYEGAVNASSAASNVESAYGAACAKLVQDDKVSYVVSYTNLSASRLACYAKAGVTLLDDQSGVPDPAGAADANLFASPGELALGRASRELVDDLWRRGWLNARSKVGTFSWDTPDGHLFISKYLDPALASHGLKPVAAAFVTNDASAANQGGTVLKFRSSGVDRVIPIAASPLFFMEAAQTQGYYPAYAVTSTWGPGALIESTAPKNQLRNAAGIGWDKYLDIGAGKMPGAVSSNETLCFHIMKSAGQASNTTTVQTFETALCNVMLFLQAVSKKFGLGPQMLQLARDANFTFPSADAFVIRLAPGRADGVSAYRDIAYETSCNCFQYTSGNRATSS